MSTRMIAKCWAALADRRGLLWAVAVISSAGFLALSLWPAGAPLRAQTNAGGDGGVVSSKFSEAQQRDIEAVVRAYLLKNPKLMLEVEQELKKLVAAEEALELKKSIAQNADFLFRRSDAPMAGNPNGDIPVVEFFDYNCGFCKRSLKDISDLIAKDPKVKVVFMEYPILSKGSLAASKVALAARMQGKYWPVHRALLEHRGGGIDRDVALKIAKTAGLDMTALERDMASAEVLGEIERVQALAQSMDIQGTPHFLVGDRGIPGAPRDLLDQIRKNVAELRKDGCPVC